MSDYQPGCSDPDEDLDGPIRCWCGAVGRYDELFDDSTLDQTCGGPGVLHCECGGDICVCHHHGEVPCDGCEDCEPEGDDWGLDDYDDGLRGGEG